MSVPKQTSKTIQIVALVFANGINFIVNFLTTPFLARKLNYEDNGTFGQVNLLNGYVVLIFSLGIGSIINLILAENKNNEIKVASNNYWILITSAFLAVLFLYCFSFFSTEIFDNIQLKQCIQLYLPSTFLLIVSSVFNYYFVYLNLTKAISYFTIFANSLRVILMYIAINYFQSISLLFIFINVINFLSLIIQVKMLPKTFRIIKVPDFAFIKYILKLSFPYLLLGILGFGIFYVDSFIVSNILGVKSYAIYRNGAIEIPFISTIYASISAVMMPVIAQLFLNNQIDEIFNLKRKISKTIACLIFPVILYLIVNAKLFIGMYLGSKYIGSALVFIFYNLATLIRINDYQDLLSIKKKPQLIIISNLIVFIFNILINVIFINIWGILGGAIAYVISIFLLAIIIVFQTLKEFDKKLIDYFDLKAIFNISILCLLASFVCKVIILNSMLLFFLLMMVYFLLVYFIILRHFKYIEINLLPEKVRNILTNKLK